MCSRENSDAELRHDVGLLRLRLGMIGLAADRGAQRYLMLLSSGFSVIFEC